MVAGPIRALIALVLFVPFALHVFKTRPRALAVAIVMVGGAAFLPENAVIDPPLLPPFDKEYISYMCALFGIWAYHRRSFSSARPGRGLEAIVVLLLLGNIATALTNTQAMWDEGKLEPGLGIWDVVARTSDDVFGVVVPYFVGRAAFRSRDDLIVLLRVLGFIGLIYAGLIAIEIAGSIPLRVFHLSTWVYGLYPIPSWRWGMIQPIVFLDHGLSVATFMGACLLAVAGLLKARLEILPIRATRARIAVALGLLMSWNVAGNVYGHVLTLCMAAFKPRTIAAIGLGLVTLSCSYPALRTVDVFPNEELVDLAKGFDRDRARSLGGRFDEEEFVMGQLGSRFWFGWGNYARTPGAETFGEGEVGIDGWWVHRIGSHGFIGLQLHYAFFAWPVLLAWRRSRRLRDPAYMSMLAALMVIVGMRSVDLLLNGWWNSLPVFLAGALAGVSASIGRSNGRPAPDLREAPGRG